MFLPVCQQDLKTRKIEQLDFIMVIGEAYVDHPSFGHAIISRLLESLGYTVGIISQPQKDADYMALGEPKYAFFISSGVIDSMVNNYSVSKKRRKKDVYSPGGKAGLRPDMATVVYTQKLKKLYPNCYCVLGSIEASLRKFAHYDYWKDTVLPPLLTLSGADLLVYGMGEHAIIRMCQLLEKGVPIEKITSLRGTMYVSSSIEKLKSNQEVIILPSFEEVKRDKIQYCNMHMAVLQEQDNVYGKTLMQAVGDQFVIQNPPESPLTTKELDAIYELPYERAYHPMYEKQGGVPALEEVKFSITSNRGCFGACNYCALTYHQGRKVQVRSHDSIIKEATAFTHDSAFKGYVHDVGGPTANFRKAACHKQAKYGVCKEKQCMTPNLCKNLEVDHTDYLNLLRKIRKIDGIKKVFIRSGIRFDYVMADNNSSFLKELCEYHVSGQLKLAPEHCVNSVLEIMGKPHFEVYQKFATAFEKMNATLGKKQYLVSYYISSHPGCHLQDAIELAEYLNRIHYMPEQVQDFYPTPGTISTCMYYTGRDPRTLATIYVPKKAKDKQMQRALLQYRKKENYTIVKEALQLAHRTDLIGYDAHCLIRPEKKHINEKIVQNTKGKIRKKAIRNVHKSKKK